MLRLGAVVERHTVPTLKDGVCPGPGSRLELGRGAWGILALLAQLGAAYGSLPSAVPASTVLVVLLVY